MYFANTKLKAQEAFVSRVWKWRQDRANKAKGLGAHLRRPGRGRGAQPLPGAPPQFGSAFPMVTIPAAGSRLQSSPVSPWSAAQPTYLEAGAMGGRTHDFRREASSDSESIITLPAAPPPSTRPSWMRSSTPEPSPLP
ncbi:hypothetical protein FRC01_012345, partial [Tulasnella sp. 417]